MALREQICQKLAAKELSRLYICTCAVLALKSAVWTPTRHVVVSRVETQTPDILLVNLAWLLPKIANYCFTVPFQKYMHYMSFSSFTRHSNTCIFSVSNILYIFFLSISQSNTLLAFLNTAVDACMSYRLLERPDHPWLRYLRLCDIADHTFRNSSEIYSW